MSTPLEIYLMKHASAGEAANRVVFHTDDEWNVNDTFTTADGALYSVPRLFKIVSELPETRLTHDEIKKLLPQLKKKMWAVQPSGKRVSPSRILRRISGGKPLGSLQGHADRILNADMTMPVSRYDGYLLDGYHRLAKYQLDGLKDGLPAKAISSPQQIERALIATWAPNAKRDMPLWRAAMEQGLAKSGSMGKGPSAALLLHVGAGGLTKDASAYTRYLKRVGVDKGSKALADALKRVSGVDTGSAASRLLHRINPFTRKTNNMFRDIGNTGSGLDGNLERIHRWLFSPGANKTVDRLTLPLRERYKQTGGFPNTGKYLDIDDLITKNTERLMQSNGLLGRVRLLLPRRLRTLFTDDHTLKKKLVRAAKATAHNHTPGLSKQVSDEGKNMLFGGKIKFPEFMHVGPNMDVAGGYTGRNRYFDYGLPTIMQKGKTGGALKGFFTTLKDTVGSKSTVADDVLKSIQAGKIPGDAKDLAALAAKAKEHKDKGSAMIVGDYLSRAARTGKHDAHGSMDAAAFLNNTPHETLLKGVDSGDVDKIYGSLTGTYDEIFEVTPKLQRHMNRQRNRFKNILTKDKRLKSMDQHGYLDLDDMMTARTLGRKKHLPPKPKPAPTATPTPTPTPTPAATPTPKPTPTPTATPKPAPTPKRMSTRKKWGIGLGVGGGTGGATYGLYRYINRERDNPTKEQKKWYNT